MHFLKHIFTLSVFSVLIFSSCKNDLQLNAPYKEIPSIFAVVNPQDKIQMIRINKVFLGEGDANVMAKVADSVNYGPGELSVKLERYVNNTKTQATSSPSSDQNVIIFRDSVIETNAGAFSTTQRVYVTSDKLFTTGDYVLTVTNTKTKNVFTARSTALDSVKHSGIIPLTDNYYYGDPANLGQLDNSAVWINYSSLTATYYIRILPNESVIYQLTMRLNYIDSLISGQTQYNYVNYSFARQNLKEAIPAGNQGPYITNTFKGPDLLNTVAEALSKSSVPLTSISGRRMYKIDFIINTSSQDYLDYLDFSAPSLSIAQDKPIYSNFEGRKAIGIFAFRSRYYIQREMHNDFKNMFAINKTTCKYKFYQVPQMVLPFCP